MPEGPVIPEDVTGEELDAEARVELRTLPKDLATKVARHLVMAGRLVDEDPATAYRHAQAARRLASRVGLVREATGLAAYHAGEWSEALAELRAARRLRDTEEAYLPILADCERGLGRPERALDLAKSPAARRLDQADRIELRIVESGARRDLGQHDAAVVTLQIPELRDKRLRPWSARLFYAYADALLEAGRENEASEWFARAAAADRDGETDAAERYAELEGLEIIDVEDDGVQEPGADLPEPPDEPGRPAAGLGEMDTPAEAEDTAGEPHAPARPETGEPGAPAAETDVPGTAGDPNGGVAAEAAGDLEGDAITEPADGTEDDVAIGTSGGSQSVADEPSGGSEGVADEPSEAGDIAESSGAASGTDTSEVTGEPKEPGAADAQGQAMPPVDKDE